MNAAPPRRRKPSFPVGKKALGHASRDVCGVASARNGRCFEQWLSTFSPADRAAD
ncbi:Hypothetical protein A7982_02552 [Minicystis rosea]|nr:Hypothetical protein A7982_02552 [Minicystis rosea]